MQISEIQSLISKLSESVQSFHERFGITGTTTREELLSRIPIQVEEVDELNYSILQSYVFYPKSNCSLLLALELYIGIIRLSLATGEIVCQNRYGLRLLSLLSCLF